jgi:hypothetical protein
MKTQTENEAAKVPLLKDPVTLAYLNLYGLLGALEDLCALVPEAKRLAENDALPGKKPVTVGFAVNANSGGPSMRLSFGDGKCTALDGADPCGIRLPFGSYEKFNGLIDGTVTPFPSKGFTRLKFLTDNFIKLTALLETYLRASPDALEDPAFFNASTTVMFFLIARAVAQVANNDKIGCFTASQIADGIVVLSIKTDKPDEKPLRAALCIKDHGFSFSRKVPERYNALMEFSSMNLARRLFDGKVNAIACVGEGLISMQGNLGMLDNVNRLLDRVAVYLG